LPVFSNAPGLNKGKFSIIICLLVSSPVARSQKYINAVVAVVENPTHNWNHHKFFVVVPSDTQAPSAPEAPGVIEVPPFPLTPRVSLYCPHKATSGFVGLP
jgi:hypothetical protein